MATSNFNYSPSYQTTDIPSIIQKYISDPLAVFVFPSSISRDSWAEWTVINHTETGVKCTPLDRWLAWDEFKAQFCSVELTGRTCIPSSLRKLFARSLLSAKMNSASPFFEKIVNAKACSSVLHFNSWLSNLIPNLKAWADKKFPSSDIKKDYDSLMASLSDAEDRDFLKLYYHYLNFLDENSLYEPSYIKADLADTEHTFIIFYPETNDDFFDYQDLYSSKNVITVSVQKVLDHNHHPKCILYPDSRSELRKTILKIRKLNESGVSWDNIALTVPDLKSISSYIERELALYEVPYLLRSGYDKTINCPGQIFVEIAECVKNNFAFPYLRALLEDTFVPWENDFYNKQIVDIANETRSLFPYKNTHSEITEDPVTHALLDLGKKDLLEYYDTFKTLVSQMYHAKTFAKMRETWTEISTNFIKQTGLDGHWKSDENNIIGLCIKNLVELEKIETDFIKTVNSERLHIENCYDFFLDKLREDPYVPKIDKFQAVSVFDYKLSGPSYYKYQFVINANQKSLSVNFRELDFLKEDKRIELDCHDNTMISESYINLYNKEHTTTEFSCSSNSFSGFDISHTYFVEIKAKNIPELWELDSGDFYIQEKKWLMENGPAPKYLSEHQVNAQKQWIARLKEDSDDTNQQKDFSKLGIEKLKYSTKGENSLDPDGKYIKISQTDMKNFFPCPRKWIFTKLLSIEEETITQNIFDHYDAGNIFHKILEYWLQLYMGKNLPISGTASWNEDDIRNQVRECVKKVIFPVISEDEKLKLGDFKRSPLRLQILQSQEEKLTDKVYNFLYTFCSDTSTPKGHFGNYSVSGSEKELMCTINGYENTDYRLYGKVDCILSNPNEEKGDAIIDFKTGHAPSAKDSKISESSVNNNGELVRGKILKDFQMACYTKLLDTTTEKKYNVQEGIFYTNKPDPQKGSEFQHNYIFSNMYNFGKTTVPRYNPETGFNNTLPVFDDYTNLMINKIETSSFSPDFAGNDIKTYVDKQDTCKKCRFNSICRTTYTMAKAEETSGGNEQ